MLGSEFGIFQEFYQLIFGKFILKGFWKCIRNYTSVSESVFGNLLGSGSDGTGFGTRLEPEPIQMEQFEFECHFISVI